MNCISAFISKQCESLQPIHHFFFCLLLNSLSYTCFFSTHLEYIFLENQQLHPQSPEAWSVTHLLQYLSLAESLLKVILNRRFQWLRKQACKSFKVFVYPLSKFFANITWSVKGEKSKVKKASQETLLFYLEYGFTCTHFQILVLRPKMTRHSIFSGKGGGSLDAFKVPSTVAHRQNKKNMIEYPLEWHSSGENMLHNYLHKKTMHHKWSIIALCMLVPHRNLFHLTRFTNTAAMAGILICSKWNIDGTLAQGSTLWLLRVYFEVKSHHFRPARLVSPCVTWLRGTAARPEAAGGSVWWV